MKEERSVTMIPPTLKLAIKHFPGHKNTLETLYCQNESFRSLCKDFRDCVQTAQYWCHSLSDKEHAHELCEEYKALCAELKDEITKWLLEQNHGV